MTLSNTTFGFRTVERHLLFLNVVSYRSVTTLRISDNSGTWWEVPRGSPPPRRRRGPASEPSPSLVGMDDGDRVLTLMLCSLGAASLLCVASLLRVVRAGCKDNSSALARLLGTGVCMAPTCQPSSTRLVLSVLHRRPRPHRTSHMHLTLVSQLAVVPVARSRST